jgi:two-component system sensor histidine kinase QseC
VGWWAVRRGLAPLQSLRAQLAQRGGQALQPVQVDDAPAEVATVADALNALLARMAQLLEAERRFTADAAHELRTPIAAIRTQAQVAQLAGDDAAGREQALRQTLAGCDRASHLVTQLLTLARLEGQTDGRASPRFDLAALVRRVGAELAGQALARQQEMSLQAHQHAPVAANEALTFVLVRNLLDNALRYSPPGAQIRLVVQASADHVRLTVDDSGPGLAPADLARLGERFFRVLGHSASGSGLGWSIVRRIAQVSGAQVLAQPSALGGLQVQVRWPRAAAPEPDATIPP